MPPSSSGADDKIIEHSRSTTLSGSEPRQQVLKMYYVYILKSLKDNTFYIGCTENINRRVNEHNKGLSKYTKNKKPWIIVYSEKFDTLANARKREKQIKSWKKRIPIEKLINGAFV